MKKEIIMKVIIGLVGIMLIITSPIIISNLSSKTSDQTDDQLDIKMELYHKLELDYCRTKDNLVDVVDSIIHFYAPTSELHGIVVVDLCEEYNIDVRFVLAQGLIESHYGTKGLARKTNSVFNIYAYDSLNYNELKDHGKFNHPDRSVEPYLKILSNDYLGVSKTEFDLMINYVNLNGFRYASDPKYEERLRMKYNQINSSKLESLMNEYQMMKLRLNR